MQMRRPRHADVNIAKEEEKLKYVVHYAMLHFANSTRVHMDEIACSKVIYHVCDQYLQHRLQRHYQHQQCRLHLLAYMHRKHYIPHRDYQLEELKDMMPTRLEL